MTFPGFNKGEFALPRVSEQSELLLALAARCEREEPSRELDAEIAAACRLVPDFDPSIYVVPLTYRALGARVEVGSMREPGRFTEADGWWTEASRSPAAFTTSLDAAVTLVGEGVEWSITNLYGIAHAEIGLNLNDSAEWQNGDHKGGHMALALCAAALRSRAAKAGGR